MTGATGFLGTQICLRLIRDTEIDIVAIIRAKDHEESTRRLQRSWGEWPELVGQVGRRVMALCGDVREDRLGLDEGTYGQLSVSITHIIHTAADMRLDGPIDELRRSNVQGTLNVLELALSAHADHGLERLSHVSTAYVAGSSKGTVEEASLSDAYGFSSRYELSKFEGEQKVQEAKARLPISVFRPGMVVGDSRTGQIKNFNTMYFPLKLYLTGHLRILPARSSLRVNLVPVDYVADAIVSLTFDERAEGLNFHLTAPYEDLPTAKELLTFVRQWALKEHGIELRKPVFLVSPVSATKGRYHAQQVITHERTGIFEGLITIAPYFNERRRFSRDNVDRLLGEYRMDWRRLMVPILEFALHNSFFHRSERTVHEQILFRLGGRRYPVRYHDVYGGRVHTRDSSRLRSEMLAVAEALRRMGVEPGDRVALVGLNSSRFIIVDVGIGLTGAVTVPLYYTSPAAEIDQILRASGAKLLLVGTPRLLEDLGELSSPVPIVSFCREDPDMHHGREVVKWTDFLATGAGTEGPTTAPVGPGDLATVRYTSGTTGTPKGVTFRHGNLSWIATTTSSLLDWRTRTTQITYLSFLPMNHVVEGIMAAYGPFYAPCSLDIFFLEDFRDLQDTLPMVRPTIFFSVPRFYEKVWEGVLKNKVGKKYVDARDGMRKELLRRLLRKGLLKKIGLSRCAQLFVGAAPTSKDLIQQFHELGIEVHDAYGLTEAPVVTMNRIGRNRVGTVGEPLPDTEVRIGDDEEVLVRGPQVTPGYLEDGLGSPLQDGWLMTGDLGYMTDEGSLVVHGRKKELIVTSYGKNVHPTKVERLLRDLEGVEEAMVLGDDRPYCCALVWVGVGDGDPDVATVERGIREVNAQLSRAEQVKRWALLNNDLSIDKGDLTASLKLKRREVSRRFATMLAALYDEGEPPSQGVLSIGGGQRGD